MSTPRKAAPSKQKIARYWSSKAGQNMIDKLQTTHLIDLDKMHDIQGGGLDFCWACSKPTSRLEKCHIIPHSNKGSNEPDNFVLMCKTCHAESPTLSDSFYFWEWFADQEHHAFKWAHYISKQASHILSDDFKSTTPLASSLQKVKQDLKPVIVSGRYSDSTTKAMIREVIKHQNAPLGWKIDQDGAEIPDNDEQELINIVRGYRQLDLSYNAIAQKLTDAKFTARRGYAVFSETAAKRINDAETIEDRTTRVIH